MAFYLGMPVPDMGKMRMSQNEYAHWFGALPFAVRRQAR